MTGERPPIEAREPSLAALELAGSLQGAILGAEGQGHALAPHQKQTLFAIGQGFVEGQVEGFVDVANDSDKEQLIAVMAQAVVPAGKRVLILASDVEAANVLVGPDRKSGLGRFSDVLKTGVVRINYGGRKDIRRGDEDLGQVVVSTYQGAVEEYKLIERGKGIRGDFDLILGAEHALSEKAETSRNTLTRYMPNAIRLGFSVSPDNTDNQSAQIWGRSWLGVQSPTQEEAQQALQIEVRRTIDFGYVPSADYEIEPGPELESLPPKTDSIRGAKQWERTLKRAGMPAELPANIVFSPNLADKYNNARIRLMLKTGEEPTSAEIADALWDASDEQRARVREFGQQLAMDSEVVLEMPTEDEDPVFEAVARIMLKDYVANTLDNYPESNSVPEDLRGRAAEILRLRYGIGIDESLNQHEVGEIFGVTPQQVGIIERRMLTRLRLPENSQALRSYVGLPERSAEAETDPSIETKKYFPSLPEVRTVDADNYETYKEYLLALSEVKANMWVEDKHEELTTFMEKIKDKWQLRKTESHLHVKPIGYIAKDYAYRDTFVSADSPKAVKIEPWTLPKVYNANELRAHALMRQRVEIDEEINAVALIQRRVASRPTGGDAQGSLETTKTVLSIRMDALRKYRNILDAYVRQYLDKEPEHVSYRWAERT